MDKNTDKILEKMIKLEMIKNKSNDVLEKAQIINDKKKYISNQFLLLLIDTSSSLFAKFAFLRNFVLKKYMFSFCII